MIKVYQIQLTDAEIQELNSKGWGGLEADTRLAAYRDRGLKFKSKYFQFYDHVANVDAADLEEAFTLMNLWNDESKVERLGPLSSMSVGDILETEDGQRYRCASFGFTAI
jgi:hypothetical protein